jgi:hypothetical protein
MKKTRSRKSRDTVPLMRAAAGGGNPLVNYVLFFVDLNFAYIYEVVGFGCTCARVHCAQPSF